MSKRKYYFIILTVSSILLALLGIVMSFSISSAVTEGFSLGLFRRQLAYALTGILFFLIFLSVNHSRLRKFSKIFFILNFILLVALFFIDRNGYRRWITIPGLPFSFQPSQFLFITLSFLMARIMSEPINEKLKFRFYSFLFLVVVSSSLLVIFEPDMGSGMHAFITGFALLFVSGMPLIQTGAFLAISVSGAAFALTLYPEWRNRVLAFLDPYSYESLDAMQGLQSLRALARGGISGVGYMRSILKFPGRLPVSSSDFVYAIVGEELGLFVCLGIVLAFVVIAYVGFRISVEARSGFSRMLSFGLTFGVVLWGLINMAVNTMLIPTTGVPLPFVSFGGNNLIANFIAIGIIANIARTEVES